MAEYDLTSRMGPFLDRHLVFPLMEFLSVKKIYDETDLQRAKLELLSNTNMVDFAMDIHNSLYPDQPIPAELPERRQRVVSELKRVEAEAEPIFQIFTQQEVQNQLQTSRDRQLMQYLIDNHNVNADILIFHG